MSNFCFKGDGLYCGKTRVGNSSVIVDALYSRPHQENPEVICCHLLTTNRRRVYLQLPYSQWNAKGISKHCPIFQCEKPTLFNRYLTELLDLVMPGGIPPSGIPAPVPFGTLLSETGLHTLPNGTACAVVGDRIVGAGSSNILLYGYPEHLSVLTDNVPHPLYRLFRILQNQPPVVTLAVSLAFYSVIRSFILESGGDFQGVGYILGPSAVGKTVLAKRVFGFVVDKDSSHSRPAYIFESGASESSLLDAMVSARDFPVVLDDIAISASRASQQKRVDLAANIIREGANASKISKMAPNRKRVDLECVATVVITAELPIQAMSELNRCILIPVRKPLNLPDELTPSLMGASILSFLQYFTAMHTAESMRSLPNNLESIIPSKLSAGLDKRVQKNFNILMHVLEIVLSAAGVDGLEQSLCSSIRSLFKEGINESIRAYWEYRQQIEAMIPKGNLAWVIYQGYTNDSFRLIKVKKPKKLDDLPACDGVLFKDCLCLYPNALMVYVQRQDGYRNYTRKQLGKELAVLGVLHLHEEDGYTVKVREHLSRVYMLDLKLLKKAAKKS